MEFLFHNSAQTQVELGLHFINILADVSVYFFIISMTIMFIHFISNEHGEQIIISSEELEETFTMSHSLKEEEICELFKIREMREWAKQFSIPNYSRMSKKELASKLGGKLTWDMVN